MNSPRISQTADRAKTEPTPACRESQIRQRPKDRLVIIRRAYVEICGGNYVAAALLNECLFVAEQRLNAGESAWFQRKSSYWVAALQGLASERTIRDAFKTIKSLRLMDFRQANGDQAGAFYRLDVDRLQAAIDGLEPDRPQEPEGDHPGKIDVPPQSELPTTPAETSGHPGKNAGGSHLSYTRAGEPSLDPFSQKPFQQQQADLGVTDSGGERATPAAADHGFSFTKTQESLKARGFDVSPGQKWELAAKASGFSDAELAETIAVPEFDERGVQNPVVMVKRAADMIRRAKAIEACDEPEPERDPREIVADADSRRIENRHKRELASMPYDEKIEYHLERAKLDQWGVGHEGPEPKYGLRPGNGCADANCAEEFHLLVKRADADAVEIVCPACARIELPERVVIGHLRCLELRSEGVLLYRLGAELRKRWGKDAARPRPQAVQA